MPYSSWPADVVGFGTVPDPSAWHSMIRATQTRAFGATVMVGLVLTWMGAVVPSYLDGASSAPFPARAPAPAGPAPTASPFSPRDQTSHGTPGMDGAAPPLSIDPNAFTELETVLAKLDQQTGGSEDVPPQQPVPATTCDPTCTDPDPSELLPAQDVQEADPPPASSTTDQPTPSPVEQIPPVPLPDTAPSEPTVVSPVGPPPGPT